MDANGDNIDSTDCSVVTNTASQRGTAPISVSQIVITESNVMENEPDGQLLLESKNTRNLLYCMCHFTVHMS